MGDSLQIDIGEVISKARKRVLKNQGKRAQAPSGTAGQPDIKG
jgi:hypothetical protein